VSSRRDDAKLPARAGKKTSRPVLPLSLLIEEYARDLRRRDIQPKTIQDYTSILSWACRIWEKQLGRPPTLDDFTVAQAEAFLDYLLEHGKDPRSHRLADGTVHSPATLRTYVRTLKIFSTWLAAPKQQYTTEPRLKLLPTPRKVRTYKRPLTAEEIQALVSVCDVTTVLGTRDLALLLTFLDGGLRVSDVLSLQVGQVNLEAGQFFIANGKGRRTRQVTLGADARRILQRYAFLRDATAGRKAAADEPFFQTDAGAAFKYQGLRSWLMRLKRAAGVTRAFPHLLRHTSAVQMLEVPGADLYTLQEKFGHADIATTREYLKMTGQQLSERQRAFSPIDHLGLDGLMRQPSPLPHVGRLWHKRVEGQPNAHQPKRSPKQPPKEEQAE
jgi:integrase/recombinase XerD